MEIADGAATFRTVRIARWALTLGLGDLLPDDGGSSTLGRRAGDANDRAGWRQDGERHQQQREQGLCVDFPTANARLLHVIGDSPE